VSFVLCWGPSFFTPARTGENTSERVSCPANKTYILPKLMASLATSSPATQSKTPKGERLRDGVLVGVESPCQVVSEEPTGGMVLVQHDGGKEWVFEEDVRISSPPHAVTSLPSPGSGTTSTGKRPRMVYDETFGVIDQSILNRWSMSRSKSKSPSQPSKRGLPPVRNSIVTSPSSNEFCVSSHLIGGIGGSSILDSYSSPVRLCEEKRKAPSSHSSPHPSAGKSNRMKWPSEKMKVESPRSRRRTDTIGSDEDGESVVHSGGLPTVSSPSDRVSPSMTMMVGLDGKPLNRMDNHVDEYTRLPSGGAKPHGGSTPVRPNIRVAPDRHVGVEGEEEGLPQKNEKKTKKKSKKKKAKVLAAKAGAATDSNILSPPAFVLVNTGGLLRPPSTRKKGVRTATKVQFAEVHVREYERVIGGGGGVPGHGTWSLGLGDTIKDEYGAGTVDSFEAERKAALEKRIANIKDPFLRSIATGETRQQSHKSGAANPLLGRLEERERKKIFEAEFVDSQLNQRDDTNETPNAKLRGGSIDDARLTTAVAKDRLEVESIRKSRDHKKLGCDCNLSFARRLNTRKLQELLRFHGLNTDGNKSTLSKRYIHEVLAVRGTCVDNSCSCFRDGVPCHDVTCQSLTITRNSGRSKGPILKCGNPQGFYKYDPDLVLKARALTLRGPEDIGDSSSEEDEDVMDAAIEKLDVDD
jgi:hypothetical protein